MRIFEFFFLRLKNNLIKKGMGMGEVRGLWLWGYLTIYTTSCVITVVTGKYTLYILIKVLRMLTILFSEFRPISLYTLSSRYNKPKDKQRKMVFKNHITAFNLHVHEK